MTANSLLKNIGKYSISNIINFFLGFLSVYLLTRLLSPEQYGFINIFNNTVALILSFVYMGLDSSFIRFYNEPPEKDLRSFSIKLIIISLCVNLVIIVALMIGGEKVCFNIFSQGDIKIWLFVGLSVAAQVILRYLNIIYRMSFNSKAYNIQAVLVLAVNKFFLIIAAAIGKTYTGMLFINVSGILILSIIYIFVQRKSIFPDKFNFCFQNYGGIFKFAILSAPLALGINLNNFLSQQIIVRNMGNYYVGIYSSAGYFSSILTALQGGFTTFWSAFMFKNYKTDNVLIKKVNDYIVFFCVLLMFIFIALKNVIYIFIGEQYFESQVFFSMVLIFPMCSLISETTSYGISISKKNEYTLVSYGIAIFTNLVCSYLLTPKFGLLGAAVANAISGAVLLAFITLFGQKFYKSIESNKRLLAGCVCLFAESFINTYVESNYKYIFLGMIIIAATICYKNIVKNIVGFLYQLITRGDQL